METTTTKLQAEVGCELSTDMGNAYFNDREMVPSFIDMLWWQERGLSYTTTGYGSKIPTEYKVTYKGRNRRVYCSIHSNSGTLYLMYKGTRRLIHSID